MSFDDTSSLSDTDSDYQEFGPVSPPGSPKHIQVIQAEIHMPPPSVQQIPPHAMDTQCVKTKSVSCDTSDINTQSFGENINGQSYQIRPTDFQFDHGYFTSTPHGKENICNTPVETPRGNGINFLPVMQSTVSQTMTGPSSSNANQAVNSITTNGMQNQGDINASETTRTRSIETTNGSQTMGFSSQMLDGNAKVFVPETPKCNLNQKSTIQMACTPRGTDMTHVSETPSENRGYQSNISQTEAWQGQIGSNISNQKHPVRHRGLSVTFDPNLTYQSVSSGDENGSYWSMNAKYSNAPTHSCAGDMHGQNQNVGAPAVNSNQSQPNYTSYSEACSTNPASHCSAYSLGHRTGHYNQTSSTPTPRENFQNLNVDSCNIAQGPGQQTGYVLQYQPIATPQSNIQYTGRENLTHNLGNQTSYSYQAPALHSQQTYTYMQNGMQRYGNQVNYPQMPVPCTQSDLQYSNLPPHNTGQAYGTQTGHVPLQQSNFIPSSNAQPYNVPSLQSVHVPRECADYLEQSRLLTNPQVQTHNAIMDPRIVVQSHGDRTNDLSQNQFRLATCPTKQTLNTQTLTQVPGEITQGFTSLNLDSFVTKTPQNTQISQPSGALARNYSIPEQTSLAAASAEQLLNQLSQVLGVSGLSLPNSNCNQPISSTVTVTQPQMQTTVVQSVPPPNPVHNLSASNIVPSVTPNTSTVTEQGRVKTLEPDSFDGSEKGPEVSEYLIHFEQIALWNRWSSDQKARMLTIKLKGEAQKLLSTLTSAQLGDFEILKQALFHRFSPKERQLAYRCEFRNRRKQKNENPVEFASALRCLGRKAYPDLSVEILEIHLVDQYVMGLGSLDLQKHVQLQHPKNLDHAVNLALEYTAICNINPDKVTKPSLLDSNENDKTNAITSLQPLESSPAIDCEKSMTKFFQKVLDKSLENVLKENTSGGDKSNNYHDSLAQNVRSPSSNSDNSGQQYGSKQVSFDETTAQKRYSPKKIVCTYCRKYNHTENFCRKKRYDDEKRQQQNQKQPLNENGLTQ